MTGEELHQICCEGTYGCPRWEMPVQAHRDYYRDKAAEITARLEPLIGAANVKPVVEAVWEVLV